MVSTKRSIPSKVDDEEARLRLKAQQQHEEETRRLASEKERKEADELMTARLISSLLEQLPSISPTQTSSPSSKQVTTSKSLAKAILSGDDSLNANSSTTNTPCPIKIGDQVWHSDPTLVWVEGIVTNLRSCTTSIDGTNESEGLNMGDVAPCIEVFVRSTNGNACIC